MLVASADIYVGQARQTSLTGYVTLLALRPNAVVRS
jgi:hypothetical protein